MLGVIWTGLAFAPSLKFLHRWIDTALLARLARSHRIPLVIPPNRYNRFYLETKRDKSGHLLGPSGRRRLAEQADPPLIKGMPAEKERVEE